MTPAKATHLDQDRIVPRERPPGFPSCEVAYVQASFGRAPCGLEFQQAGRLPLGGDRDHSGGVDAVSFRQRLVSVGGPGGA